MIRGSIRQSRAHLVQCNIEEMYHPETHKHSYFVILILIDVPPHFVEKLNFRQQSVNIAFENEYTDLRHGK